MGASCKPKYDDPVSQSSSTEDDLHTERKKKTKSRGKVERKKNIAKLTHRPPLNQPHSHLNPLHPLHPENPAKIRIKPRKGMGKKSRNAQEVCILNVLTVIFVYSSLYIYVSFYLFVYLATHCSEMGQGDTFFG